MELGFSTMNTLEDVRPDLLARSLEDRGYTSLFIGEHSHIPVARLTPYPSGGAMPDQYRRMMDPFVSLTMAATATERLRVGLRVCLVLEHHVLDLAKSVATLDVLSGGRVLFGVGVGWNVEELRNHRPDISWGQRYRATQECVEALRRLDPRPRLTGHQTDDLWPYAAIMAAHGQTSSVTPAHPVRSSERSDPQISAHSEQIGVAVRRSSPSLTEPCPVYST